MLCCREPYHPGGAQASARIFDGNNDYVLLPEMNGRGRSPKGSFPILTLDTWIKWMDVTGNQPIMNEDHWDRGDLHYQIYAGEYGFDVNGVGDKAFVWQPQPLEWYFLSVQYSSLPFGDNANSIMLYVNNRFQEKIVRLSSLYRLSFCRLEQQPFCVSGMPDVHRADHAREPSPRLVEERRQCPAVHARRDERVSRLERGHAWHRRLSVGRNARPHRIVHLRRHGQPAE